MGSEMCIRDRLTDSVAGTPIDYADDLDIGPDGIIYFSDASTKFGAKNNKSTLSASLLEIIEHRGTGRVLAYDPKTKTTSIIKTGFVFSNGVAMHADGQSLLVNETGTYSVHRIWVSGPRKGESEIFIDNMPGFPDNINPGPVLEGVGPTYLLGLISMRSQWLDDNAKKSLTRKIAMRLPAFMRPQKRWITAILSSLTVRVMSSKHGKIPVGTFRVLQGLSLRRTVICMSVA